ncbi:B12-binding domain-containing protein, partial [Candidatus Bathyarchaeota archaeon]|nr:B12-binding domain-containing protein [Candidatus Bathyarchaeota archaeon]
MTTSSTSVSSEQSKRLTEVILKGDEVDAARIARELTHGRSEANDVLDTISETMNIVADLHEVERYTPEQVAGCERAAEKALDAIRPRIRLEQKRISGRVMVTSLKGDPHSFDKTLLLTMLEIGGISALDGGEELTPEDVSKKVASIKPDVLAIPLVTGSAAESLMDTKSRLDSSGTKIRIVAYGRGVANL